MARTRTRSLDQPEENTEHETEVLSDSRRRRRRDAVESTEQSVARQDRPASSTRQVNPLTSTNTSIVNRIPVVRSIVAYFRGVASELKKVTWPDRDETVRLTTVVLGVTVTFAIVLGLLDTFLAWWFRQAFSSASEAAFLAIAAVAAVISGGAYVFLRDRI